MLRLLAFLALIPLLASARAFAGVPVDCPLHDAPFSIDTPLIDVLLNAQARAAANEALGGKLDNLPPEYAGTTPPTFAAIMDMRTAAAFTGIDAPGLARLDARLRAIPVTSADRRARCARYDNDRPVFRLATRKPHILLFEKINGFKDEPGFNAAQAALVAMAQRKGWDLVVTDKGGAFTPKVLRSFDAVIWNNVSGDVLTLSQRKAFQAYIEGGGAYVGVHGSAGDPVYFWDWYADRLLGARFAGHPLNPQFQDARVVVDKAHPVAARLPAEWTMKDEWYSFRTNPRKAGAAVIATLDESTYHPVGPTGERLTMGDHPIAWTNRIGKGRMFYSAIGHLPEAYSDPRYVAMLEDGISWAMSDSPETRR